MERGRRHLVVLQAALLAVDAMPEARGAIYRDVGRRVRLMLSGHVLLVTRPERSVWRLHTVQEEGMTRAASIAAAAATIAALTCLASSTMQATLRNQHYASRIDVQARLPIVR